MRRDRSDRPVRSRNLPIGTLRSVTLLALTLILFAGPIGHGPGEARLVPAAIVTAQVGGEVLTDCTVLPRRRAELVALAQAPPGLARSGEVDTALGTPEPPAAGRPADSQIATSVTATAREMVACYNAGDLRRLFALYSHEYLCRVWGGFAGANPSRAELAQTLDFISTPVPQPDASQVAFLSVEDVRQLPNGDVSAIVTLSNGSSRSVFVYSDGWYQLVWAYPVPDSAAPPP